MIRIAGVFLLSLIASIVANARVWTSSAGSTLEADLISISDDKVRFRPANGNILETSIYNLSEPDKAYLKGTDWQNEIYGSGTATALNKILGFQLLNGKAFWQESTDAVAARLSWRPVSKTDFMSSYRMESRRNARAQMESEGSHRAKPRRAYFYGKSGQPDYFLLVYDTIRDVQTTPENQKHEAQLREQLNEEIEASYNQIRTALSRLLGEPERQAFFNGRPAGHRMLRWDFGELAFLLSKDECFGLSLYIHRTEFANKNGRVEFTRTGLETWFADNVEKRSNGDVVIKNLPMVSQGEGGFCVPATFERYLHYVGIPADMYTLAMLGETRIRGGTRLNKLRDETSRYLEQQGLQMRRITSALSMNRIAEHIDRGMPLIWTMNSTKTFNEFADDYTRSHKEGKSSPALPEEEVLTVPHTLIITGYNKESEAIAISDSWGPRYEERWIPLAMAERYDLAGLYVIEF